MTSQKKFSPPTLDEWMFYADSIGWMPREDAEAAYDHYLSVGWKVGGQPMCDWQAAARNCKRRSGRCGPPAVGSGVGRFRHHAPVASLGALQVQLKQVEEELEDLIRPGGCAFPRTLTLEQSQKAERLREQRTRIKERMSYL